MAVIAMPAVDTVNGGYLTPLQTGDVIRFYLSDTTGNPANSGTILWRSVNGTPDSAWSLRNGTRGTMDLGDNKLSFSYSPTSSPDAVTVTVTATKSAGDAPAIQTTASTEILLRNHQAANP